MSTVVPPADKSPNPSAPPPTAVQAAAQAAGVAAAQTAIKLTREKDVIQLFLEQVNTIAMSLVIVAVVIGGLYFFALMLQQLLLALFLVYLIMPVRNWLARYRLSGVVIYSILLLGILLCGSLLGLLIQQSVADFQEKWPAYEKNINTALREAGQWIPGMDEKMFEQIVLGANATEQESAAVMRDYLVRAFDYGGQLLIVLVYVAFLLAEGRTINRRLRTAFHEAPATNAMIILHRINASISKYISVITVCSILVGGSTTLVLWLFGVDYAILWGIIAFVLNYVPYIGAAIAVIFPSALAVVQLGSPTTGIVIFVLLNAIHSVIGYWLEPILAGDRLDLSPLVFIVSLAFWATLWGVVGMIMAVPLMVSVKILLENIPATRPLAALLANVRHGEK